MSNNMSLEEILAAMNETARKNYAMTELLMQTFSAYVNLKGDKEVIADFVKSTRSSGELVEAHSHAQNVFLALLNSVTVVKDEK